MGLGCCVRAFSSCSEGGATPHCGVHASHCGGPSRCGAWAPGVWASAVVAHRLQSTGSAVVAHGPSRPAACGILPDQGLNPYPLHWQADFQPLCHQGSPNSIFNRWKYFWVCLFMYFVCVCVCGFTRYYNIYTLLNTVYGYWHFTILTDVQKPYLHLSPFTLPMH